MDAGRIWRIQVGLRRARMAGTSMALKAARRASAVWRWRVGGMVAATGRPFCGNVLLQVGSAFAAGV